MVNFVKYVLPTIKENVIARKKYSTNSAEKCRKEETPKAMDKLNPRKNIPREISLHKVWDAKKMSPLHYGLNRVPTK